MDTETSESERALMAASIKNSCTTPPTSPVGLSKPQPTFSTPDTNHTSNSTTGVLDDIFPRLKAELKDCHMVDLPFDNFLRRFVTLEDAIYARIPSDDRVAISARNPSNTSVLATTNLPRDTSERELVPWLCQQANIISASCLESLVPQTKRSSTTIHPYATWFQHGELPLGTESKNVRKMDFGLVWKEYPNTNRSNDRVHWADVEIVGEHTNRQHSVAEKSVKLAEYARHALRHQPDRRFIFGLLLHRSDLSIHLFTSVGMISSRPFDLLADPVNLEILIRGLTNLPAEKRGLDTNFTRVESSGQAPAYLRLLHVKIAAKQVEESGAQRLIEPGSEEAASAGFAVAEEKYSPGEVGIKSNTADDCECLNAQATLLGPLYRSSSLIGRRTQVWLAELTLSDKHEGFEHQPSPTQIVIKIIARDVEATLNEGEMLKKAASHGNIDVPWLLSHKELNIRGYPDTTHDLILQNWEPVTENLRIRRRREITISKSIGVPLVVLRPPPFRLLQIARDIIVTLERLHNVDILHRDVSVNNIMCTLKKGESIVLEGDAHVTTKGPTLLAGRNDTVREAFLNDYDLATYRSEASGMTTLTGTWAFIAPSRLEKWGDHHAHQDVVSVVLCIIWMACLEPAERILEEDRPERHETTPPSHNQHRFALRPRPPKPIGTNNRSAKPNLPLISKSNPSLDHPHIKMNSNDALLFKTHILARPWKVIDDMAVALSTAPETTYIPDRKMEAQMEQGNVKAHKAYVQLMDSRFPQLVQDLIGIIDRALKELQPPSIGEAMEAKPKKPPLLKGLKGSKTPAKHEDKDSVIIAAVEEKALEKNMIECDMDFVLCNHGSPNDPVNVGKLHTDVTSAVDNDSPALYYQSDFCDSDDKDSFSELHTDVAGVAVDEEAGAYHHGGFGDSDNEDDAGKQNTGVGDNQDKGAYLHGAFRDSPDEDNVGELKVGDAGAAENHDTRVYHRGAFRDSEKNVSELNPDDAGVVADDDNPGVYHRGAFPGVWPQG